MIDALVAHITRLTWRRPAALVALALAVVVPAGCGGGDDESGPPPVDTPSGGDPTAGLTDYLSSESFTVQVADLTAFREQLGLPEDADALPDTPADVDKDPADPDRRLLSASVITMPELSFAIQTLQRDPIAEAFDGTAISAAATSGGAEGTLSAIRTSQTFDDLAGALEDQGYERDGDTLSNPDARIGEVSDAGDGVFVIAGADASAADAVADPPGGPAEAVALLEPRDEPLGQAVVGLAEDCVQAFGGWENAEGTAGTIRLALDDEADADRVDVALIEENASLATSEPVVDGDSVEVPFENPGQNSGSPIRDLLISFPSEIYDCG